MEKYDDRIKLDIFKARTTYQNDYKQFPIQKIPKTSQQPQSEEKKKIKPPPHVLRDNETYAKWRPNVHIPFNLLWRPKDIIGTNPYQPFEIPIIPEHSNKEDIIKTRPRIYMSPAISMDDIEDPEIRKILCDQTYITEWAKAIQESEVQAAKRDIPNTTIEVSGDPVRFKPDMFPPLPDKFRKINGKAFENKQLKFTVDPTKTFWETKTPPVKCGACYDPIAGLVPQETVEEIRELIRTDKLRLVHDAPIPGYAGYKPRFSGNVSLAKVDMPVVHPYMSVTQAITKRYQTDKKN